MVVMESDSECDICDGYVGIFDKYVRNNDNDQVDQDNQHHKVKFTNHVLKFH